MDFLIFKIIIPAIAIIIIAILGIFLFEKIKKYQKMEQSMKEYEDTKKKLSEVEKMKNEFISIITHELSTPVARTAGYLSMLAEDKENIPLQYQDYLERAVDSIKRLSALISALLRASRISFEEKENIFDIGPIIADVIKSYEDTIHRKGLTVFYDPGSYLPLPFVLGSASSIKEVLDILLDNAIKFTDKGYIRISLRIEENKIYINVEDTGCGIAEEDLPHIFEKFYQADTSYTREKGGVGLGLYLAKKIIEMNKGKIWAKSKMGEGTIFTFVLSIAKSPKI